MLSHANYDRTEIVSRFLDAASGWMVFGAMVVAMVILSNFLPPPMI